MQQDPTEHCLAAVESARASVERWIPPWPWHLRAKIRMYAQLEALDMALAECKKQRIK